MTTTTASSTSTSSTTMEKPKRPLSAYNLYYRHKRNCLIATAIAGDDALPTLHRIIASLPGLEDHPALCQSVLNGQCTLPAEQVHHLRRTAIRASLEDASPRDNRNRHHLKKCGGLSFLEMNNFIASSWKTTDAFAVGVFKELAEEKRAEYKVEMAEWKRLHPEEARKIKKGIEASAGSAPRGDNTEDTGRSTSSSLAAPAADKPKAERPKRPLSAYNLFYRYKRSKVLAARESGNGNLDHLHALLMAPPGLEDAPVDPTTVPSHMVNEMNRVRRTAIRDELQDKMDPHEERNRSQRKFQGARGSFLEFNRVVVESWKRVDAFSKSVFEELAAEAREAYVIKMREFDAEHPDAPKKKRAKHASGGKNKVPRGAQRVARVAQQMALHEVARAAGLPLPTHLPVNPMMDVSPLSDTRQTFGASLVTPVTSMDTAQVDPASFRALPFASDAGRGLPMQAPADFPIMCMTCGPSPPASLPAQSVSVPTRVLTKDHSSSTTVSEESTSDHGSYGEDDSVHDVFAQRVPLSRVLDDDNGEFGGPGYESEDAVSVHDFMELINTLDENLTD